MTGHQAGGDGFNRRMFDDWWAHAACPGTDVEMRVEPWDVERVAEAKKVCAGCPVRLNCLDFAVTTGQSGGVWGGMDDKERDEHRVELSRRRQALRAV